MGLSRDLICLSRFAGHGMDEGGAASMRAESAASVIRAPSRNPSAITSLAQKLHGVCWSK